jgi:hypothetical protein
MNKKDLNFSEMAGRKPAEDRIQQALITSPNADSCLPSPPYSIRLAGGTALFELESLIRNLLETSGQGVRPLNDARKRICSTPQVPHEIDLLAVTKGHKAR